MTALATIEQQTTALARPGDEMSVEQLVERVRKVHEVQRAVMKEDVHFGRVPGVDKPMLLKPGAEVLGMTFRLAPDFEIAEQVRDGDHLTVVVRCKLIHSPSGAVLGSGLGSCSTKESKYAYRRGERTCPECGKAAIIRGKEDWGGGWLCFAKRGGCGAKFKDRDPAIVEQPVGRVENPDLYDQHNTVLKMAIKRAHVAAILFVTCASEIFTQDEPDEDYEAPSGKQERQSQSQRAPNQRQAGPDVETELGELLHGYTEAKSMDDVSKLERLRERLWKKLSTAQRKASKEAVDRAVERLKQPAAAVESEQPTREPGDDE